MQMDLKHLKLILPFAVVAIAMAAFGILVLTKPVPDTKPVTEKVWSVSVKTINPGARVPTVLLYGRVESPRHATLKAAVSAEVVSTPAQEGKLVNKGDLLVALDPSDMQLLVKQREAEVMSLQAQIATEQNRYESDKKSLEHEKQLVALSQKSVDRQLTLLKKDLTAPANREAAEEKLRRQSLVLTQRELAVQDHNNRQLQLEAQLLRMRALLDQANLDLSRCQIKAPFTGPVAKLWVAVGDRVRPGDSIVEIFDSEALEVRAQIPQQYLSTVDNALDNKQEIIATVEARDQRRKLKLDRLASMVAQGRSGVDGLFVVLNQKSSDYLALGRTITLNMQLPAVENVVSLPSQALYSLEYVYVVTNNRLKKITVHQVGVASDKKGNALILMSSPKLKKGDKVLVNQIPNAISGLKVNIVEDIHSEQSET